MTATTKRVLVGGLSIGFLMALLAAIKCFLEASGAGMR